MKRAAIVAAGALAAVLGAAYGAASALSDTATGAGAANSRAAQSNAGTVTTHVTNSGLAGGLISLVTTNLAQPLASLPSTIVQGLANGITDSGFSAVNPNHSQPRPSGTYNFPTCGQLGWTDPGDCYGPSVPSVSTSAVSLSVGSTQGYATGDSSGYVAATQAADPNLGLLGVTIGDLGLVQSAATCDTSTCTPDQRLSNGSLFGGALTYSLVNGTVVAKVGGVTVGTTPVTVTSAVKASVSATNLLTLTITLSTNQVLGAVGQTLSSLGTLLGDTLTVASTTSTLTVTIGPGNTVGTGGSSATAWGLDVNATLNADVKLNVLSLLGLGLGSVEVTATGALVDLKLAYSSATAGALPADWVPPALI
jgi:hypothetical protein